MRRVQLRNDLRACSLRWPVAYRYTDRRMDRGTDTTKLKDLSTYYKMAFDSVCSITLMRYFKFPRPSKLVLFYRQRGFLYRQWQTLVRPAVLYGILLLCSLAFCSSHQGFFKGTSAEQDRRFSDKELKLLRTMKFPSEFDKKVGIA